MPSHPPPPPPPDEDDSPSMTVAGCLGKADSVKRKSPARTIRKVRSDGTFVDKDSATLVPTKLKVRPHKTQKKK